LNGSSSAVNGSSSSSTATTNDLSQSLTDKLNLNHTESANNEINRFKSFDVKAMQKEAVLSYVKVSGSLAKRQKPF
jgi:hypothetical protein